MPVIKFKDLNKKANDALSKGFDANHSVKFSTKGASDVKYTAEVKGKGSGKVASKVSASFKHSSGVNVKKLEVNNKGILAAQVNLEGVIDNTTFTGDIAVQAVNVLGQHEKTEVGVNYANDKVNVEIAVSPLLPTAANASVVVKAHDNVLVGASYGGQLDDTWAHTSNSIGLQYASGGNQVALTAANNLENFTLSAHHSHSDAINIASQIAISRSNPSVANITVGGSYAVDADTTVKGKINVPAGSLNGSTLSLGFNQKLNGNVRLTTGTQLNLSEDNVQATYGVGLEFGSV